MRILVTGSSGFIGFHTSLLLLKNKHEVIGVDNAKGAGASVIDLQNSDRASGQRCESVDRSSSPVARRGYSQDSSDKGVPVTDVAREASV